VVRKGRWLLLSLVLVLAPPAGAAGVYQWTDADGASHFTDDPSTIPQRFRGTVRQLRPPDAPSEPKNRPSEDPEFEPPAESQLEPVAEPDGPPPAPSEPVDARGNTREWWRERIQEWQKKKADAQAKLADAQTRLARERFLNTGGYDREREISEEISRYEKQVREAETMLTEGLADEARKAQAPPGWLRE
jgi:hypothetical protein